MAEIKTIDISKIKINPSNPRKISGEKMDKLVKSIQGFPEMLKIRPIVVNDEMVVLGGNMRLTACKKAGLKEIPYIKAGDLTPEQQREFIIKDNIGFGEWNWELIDMDWDREKLDEWGLDMPQHEQIDKMEDGEVLEIEQSLQIEPPMEYILIMAEPNSEDWEDIKERLKLKMVRRGGYKDGSPFDAISLERVLIWNDFKNRYNADSDTK